MSKAKELTPLEMKAEQLVKEEDLFDDETSDQDIELKLEMREGRIMTESLLDYLHRQTKNQVRKAFKNPLKKISKKALERAMKSDSLKADNLRSILKKDRSKTPHKTPSKEKRAGFERDLTRSANRIAFLNSSMDQPAMVQSLKDNGAAPSSTSAAVSLQEPVESKEFRSELKKMTDLINDKQYLINMLMVKLSDNKDLFKVVRQLVNAEAEKHGGMDLLEKKIIDLQNLNDTIYKNLKSNEEDNVDVFEQLKHISDIVENEKDNARQYYDNQINKLLKGDRENRDKLNKELNVKIEDLMHENKALQEAMKTPLNNNAFLEKANLLKKQGKLEDDINSLNADISLKDAEINHLKDDIDRLQNLMDDIRSDNDRKVQALNDRLIKSQEAGLKNQKDTDDSLKKEIDAVNADNHRLNKKNNELEEKLERKNIELSIKEDEFNKKLKDIERNLNDANRNTKGALENEIDNLKSRLSERDNEVMAKENQHKEMLNQKENQRLKQKNEWADIYGNLKQEIEDLKHDNDMLNMENEKLKSQFEGQEKTTNYSKAQEKEIIRKYKKKQLECQALWDTLKDVYVGGRIDPRQFVDLLSVRALDSKGKRKLKI